MPGGMGDQVAMVTLLFNSALSPLFCILAVLAICGGGFLVWVAYDPFQGTYPRCVVRFDFSRKKEPDISMYICDELVREDRWADLRQHRYKKVGAWRARCENKIAGLPFQWLRSHRTRQYQWACDDRREFVFQGIRHQTRYRQVNYIKHKYDVPVVDVEVYRSFDELLDQKDRLAPGTLTMKEFAALQRKRMTKDVRERIMKRDRFTCQVCGKYMPDGVGVHIDHIVPVSKGGRTEDGNLRVTCSVCNPSKGNKILTD